MSRRSRRATAAVPQSEAEAKVAHVAMASPEDAPEAEVAEAPEPSDEAEAESSPDDMPEGDDEAEVAELLHDEEDDETLALEELSGETEDTIEDLLDTGDTEELPESEGTAPESEHVSVCATFEEHAPASSEQETVQEMAARLAAELRGAGGEPIVAAVVSDVVPRATRESRYDPASYVRPWGPRCERGKCPKKVGTKAWDAWQAYGPEGRTIAEYFATRTVDQRKLREALAWDLERGFVTLERP